MEVTHITNTSITARSFNVVGVYACSDPHHGDVGGHEPQHITCCAESRQQRNSFTYTHCRQSHLISHHCIFFFSPLSQLVGKNSKFQQSLATVGLIPAMIRFGGRMFPLDIRLEAANFVRQLCYASDFTRKMFIACDGLPVLLSFLEENYEHNKTLMWNAIDCIRHVFEITTNPKNDICRLFCKFGLLEPLTRTLEHVNNDTDSPEAAGYVKKIGDLLFLFSQGDVVVKCHFAKVAVIENMLRVLPSLPSETLLLVLKSIRSISMESSTLDLLEQAGGISSLHVG